MKTRISTPVIAILAAITPTCYAQAPTPAVEAPLITPAKVRAAAEALSNRAQANASQLDFPTYRGDAGLLIAEGDSWYDYPFYDVLQNLEGIYHYQIESSAHHGDTLESMVYGEDQLSSLALKMSRVAALRRTPLAILLSGGGNDVAGPELALLLNHAKSGLPQLNENVLSGVLDVRLQMSYLTFIQAITNLSKTYFKRTTPVLIHGYDYPVPDGRGYWGGWGPLPGPWLRPYFEQKGYANLQLNAKTLRLLIDRVNDILERIPKQAGFEHVCYVRVRGTLSDSIKPPNPYDGDWNDELHPTRQGFRKVAERFQDSLNKCAKAK